MGSRVPEQTKGGQIYVLLRGLQSSEVSKDSNPVQSLTGQSRKASKSDHGNQFTQTSYL